MGQYPDISGVWEQRVKFLGQGDPNIPPSFKDITTHKNKAVIKQHGPFFFVDEEAHPGRTQSGRRIGGLIQEYGKWKIYLSDYDDFATIYASYYY